MSIRASTRSARFARKGPLPVLFDVTGALETQGAEAPETPRVPSGGASSADFLQSAAPEGASPFISGRLGLRFAQTERRSRHNLVTSPAKTRIRCGDGGWGAIRACSCQLLRPRDAGPPLTSVSSRPISFVLFPPGGPSALLSAYMPRGFFMPSPWQWASELWLQEFKMCSFLCFRGVATARPGVPDNSCRRRTLDLELLRMHQLIGG